MLDHNVFTVRIWTGEEKQVKKIALFPEMDNKGEVFFKIEGQLNLDHFMINYYYDRDKALQVFTELLDDLMEYQVHNLQSI
jgi:hypothetical protein